MRGRIPILLYIDMLGISIDGAFLDLFANTSIGFELNSPIFLSESTDIIPGSYSFPFSIPNNTRNRSILNSPAVIDNAAPTLSAENVEIRVHGIWLFSATAYIKQASPAGIQLYLIVTNLESLKDRQLNEIPLGGDRSIGPDAPAHAKLTAQNPESYDYAFFPIYNPDFWGVEEHPGGFLAEIQNPYDSNLNIFREEDDALVAMPFCRLDYLLQQMFADQSLSLQNDFQTITELQRLYVYNNYSIYTDAGAWSTTINLQNHVSESIAADFIKGLGKNFCLGWFYSPFNKEVRLVPLKDLIVENHSFDWTSKAARDYTISIERFFPGVFCYQSSIDQMESILLEYPVEIVGEELTVADAVTAGGPGYYYIISTNSYRYIPLTGPDPAYDKKTKICKDTGYNEEELASQVGTMYMDETTLNYGSDVLPILRYNFGPFVRIPGTYPPLQQKNPMPDKLIFYRGMQLNNFLEQYPLASNNVYDQNALNLAGVEYSLLWDRDEGLYKKWWEPWHLMLQEQKQVSRILRLDIDDLLAFTFDKKVRIENMDFFVKKLSVSISANGLAPVAAELVSVA